MDHVCAPTSTSDTPRLLVLPYRNWKGWVYFYSSYLKVVTDQDIRDSEIYEVVNRNTANYPLPDLDAQMEVQLLVQTTGEEGVANLFLVVNHKECVASYDLQEVRDENVALLELNARKYPFGVLSIDVDAFTGIISGIILHMYLHQQEQFQTHPTH
ncbi:hypothetical protein C0989_012357 [Termitomyces sp. Mn162]|nr:hypothetical protein C0989_012357 [Termitomyces sp. Mn162]